MLDHTERNAAIMRRIRDLGMHISLDDFGTGYSSLTYLRRLPIDSIKIDRSFLESLGTEARDNAMLRAIVNLGSAHDLVVVAEGIDTEAKLAAVRASGCNLGQGFLFAKPMPIEGALAVSHPLPIPQSQHRLIASAETGGRPDRRGSGPPSGDEDRDHALGLRLVLGVVGIRGDGPLPPHRPLVAGHLAHVRVERLGTVLDDDRLGVGLAGCSTRPGASGAPPIEATSAYSPSCSTRMSGVLRSLPLLLPRVVTMMIASPVSRSVLASRPAGALVRLDLVAHPLPRDSARTRPQSPCAERYPCGRRATSSGASGGAGSRCPRGTPRPPTMRWPAWRVERRRRP